MVEKKYEKPVSLLTDFTCGKQNPPFTPPSQPSKRAATELVGYSQEADMLHSDNSTVSAAFCPYRG